LNGAPLGFDTTAATPSLPAWTCVTGGNDLWYSYTATNTAGLRVETCGSAYDTGLELFSGSCGALTLISCNDDACALQSALNWSPTNGTTYFIRVGGFASQTGTGTIVLIPSGISPGIPVNIVSNIAGTFLDISTTGTPLNLVDDGEVDIPTTIGNALLAAGVARVGSNGGVRFAGAGTDLGFTNAALPSAAAFNLTSQSLLPFWDDVNTVGGTVGNIYWQETGGRLVIQWEDVGFFGAASEIATFQIQVFPAGGPAFAQYLYQDVTGVRAAGGGSATIGYQAVDGTTHNQFSFNTAGAVSNGTVLSVVPLGPVGVGTSYCGPQPVNTTGSSGTLMGSGSASVAANNLSLNASSLPANQFGFFITSQTQGFTPNPGGSQGNLCLTGTIGRYVAPGQIKNAGASGAFSLALNLTQTPAGPVFVSVMSGQTWNFQAWYRDIGPMGQPWSNFTNGLSVSFVN